MMESVLALVFLLGGLFFLGWAHRELRILRAYKRDGARLMARVSEHRVEESAEGPVTRPILSYEVDGVPRTAEARLAMNIAVPAVGEVVCILHHPDHDRVYIDRLLWLYPFPAALLTLGVGLSLGGLSLWW